MKKDEEIELLRKRISEDQRKLSLMLKEKNKKKGNTGRSLIRNFHLGLLKDQNKYDFVIEADGGTSCNIPSKGYGEGYGSYRISCGTKRFPVQRLKFWKGFSANGAEIMTIAMAIEDVAARLEGHETKDYSILIRSDSEIALKNVVKSTNKDYNGSGSESFITAIQHLKRAIKHFENVDVEWRPRECSVEIFGH